jgi:hypothetical protein
MTYLAFADFRTATLNEACAGLSLTVAEASDATVTSAIADLSARLDAWTDDHYESLSTTLTIDAPYCSPRLYLPKRCTAISSVRTKDYAGVQTNQAASVYRLHTSLDPAGAVRIGDVDWLQITPLSAGLTLVTDPFEWPTGVGTVDVAGIFGWTVTPGDIKRALALMVYYRLKPLRADLRLAESVASADSQVRYGQTSPSGIPEADEIISDYKRDVSSPVG